MPFYSNYFLHVAFRAILKHSHTYGLLTKRVVKMAGYWLGCFFVCMDRDKVEVHKHTKKEQGLYPAILTEQAWAIKKCIIWDKTPKHDTFSLWDKPHIPSGQESSILPTRVANQSARFSSSFPLTEIVLL